MFPSGQREIISCRKVGKRKEEKVVSSEVASPERGQEPEPQC